MHDHDLLAGPLRTDTRGVNPATPAVQPYLEAGFDQVALIQIGGEQQEEFIAWAEEELLPALRSL